MSQPFIINCHPNNFSANIAIIPDPCKNSKKTFSPPDSPHSTSPINSKNKPKNLKPNT